MEFEADRRCTTSIGFRDPREDDGELLFPARFPAEVVARDKRAMGELGTAGQFQQRPTPRGGGLFPTDRFVVVDHPPEPVGDRPLDPLLGQGRHQGRRRLSPPACSCTS